MIYLPHRRKHYAASGDTDPLWANVELLLGFEGSDGATTTTDESSNGFTVTRGGQTEIDTAQFKFGTSSTYFPSGGNDYWQVAHQSALQLVGDFTMEAWVRFVDASTGANQTFWDYGSAFAFRVGVTSTGNLTISCGSNGSSYNIANGVTFGALSDNTWHHIAVNRDGTAIRGYLDGVGTSLGTSSADIYNDGNSPLTLGYVIAGPTNAWMDEFRLTIGADRYPSDFTPPIAAFPRS